MKIYMKISTNSRAHNGMRTFFQLGFSFWVIKLAIIWVRQTQESTNKLMSILVSGSY